MRKPQDLKCELSNYFVLVLTHCYSRQEVHYKKTRNVILNRALISFFYSALKRNSIPFLYCRKKIESGIKTKHLSIIQLS